MPVVLTLNPHLSEAHFLTFSGGISDFDSVQSAWLVSSDNNELIQVPCDTEKAGGPHLAMGQSINIKKPIGLLVGERKQVPRNPKPPTLQAEVQQLRDSL